MVLEKKTKMPKSESFGLIVWNTVHLNSIGTGHMDYYYVQHICRVASRKTVQGGQNFPHTVICIYVISEFCRALKMHSYVYTQFSWSTKRFLTQEINLNVHSCRSRYTK